VFFCSNKFSLLGRERGLLLKNTLNYLHSASSDGVPSFFEREELEQESEKEMLFGTFRNVTERVRDERGILEI
jgi:hypothetical protein